jgi:PAS domain S-box-containing protein
VSPTAGSSAKLSVLQAMDGQEAQTMVTSNRDGFPQGAMSNSSKIAGTSLHNFLDVLLFPIYYLDRAGIFLACNRAFVEQIMGDGNLTITGQSLVDLKDRIPDKLFDLCKKIDIELINKSGRQRHEATLRCGDGQTRTFIIHHSILLNDDHHVVGIAGDMLDITTDDATGAELKQYRDNLEAVVVQRSKELISANDQLSKEIEQRRRVENALHSSQERYRSIFENISAATVVIEPDMTVSMANANAEKMAGLSRDQFVGRTKFLDFVLPRHHDRLALYHELVLKGDSNVPQQFEFQFIDGNGRVRDVLANLQWLPDTRRVVASLLDITEKNHLQKERMRLAAVIDQSAEAMIITNKRGRVGYVNQAFEELSGFARSECIGQTLDAHFLSDEDRRILKQMTFMVSGTDLWSGRVKNLCKDGSVYIADTRIFPICGERGNVINLVCVKTDVTHEVQLEKQLHQAQKMEAIGTLAGGIAHDFNNILGGILGYTELSMLRAGENDRLRYNLNRVIDGCQRAKELVQNILAFSRKNDEECKPIEIQIIVKEALKLLRASIPSIIEFKQRITSEPSIVHATPTQVHQIIMNLCTNAFQAMEKTGGVLEILLENIELSSAQCEGKSNLAPGPHCRLSIRDTGDGMDGKTLERIFEPYFSTKVQTGGTGLGLSVVHGIVNNFGGAILVDSHVGSGSTFDIYLPRVEKMLIANDTQPASLPGGNEYVLVADDELFILEIMTDMLSSLGYHVDTAIGGKEAIDKFSSAPERFDVVIVDLAMPKITGTQLALKIKQIRNDVPIILTTGMTYRLSDRQDEFNDFAAVLNKPILYEKLAKTLREVLNADHNKID